MRTFQHFPKNKVCLMCGSEKDEECTLVEIDGTDKGNICQAIPVHVKCVTKGDLRYNRSYNVFYKIGVSEKPEEETGESL